jgi:N-acetylglucosamine-6-phosphate deacetylase
MRLGVAAALVDGEVVAGDLEVAGGRIVSVGATPAGRSGLAVPGFVDVQVNGFAGVAVTGADQAGYRTLSTALAATGVTGYLATIPTASVEAYPVALAEARAAIGGGLPGARALGVHLEGPYLSTARPGAHRVDRLRTPAALAVDDLLDRAPVALMTVAPEIEGGLDLVAHLRRRGVVVSVGHSDATASEAHRAFDAGAAAHTHLWNAHRPITSRDPGPGGAALARTDVVVCLIADLIHVSREVLRFSMAAARGRVLVTTDAVAAAGLGDGEVATELGPVMVADGAARLSDGTLAGSVCPLDQMLRNVVGLGIPLPEAVDMVTRTPARLLGRDDVGSLAVGAPADVVVLDDALAVQQVLVAGRPQL